MHNIEKGALNQNDFQNTMFQASYLEYLLSNGHLLFFGCKLPKRIDKTQHACCTQCWGLTMIKTLCFRNCFSLGHPSLPFITLDKWGFGYLIGGL